MTTEINAAQAAQVQAAAGVPVEELREETKQELEALGIVAIEGMTEAEAQIIIEEARAEQEDIAPQQAAGRAEINSDIKNLATIVGISYEDKSPPEEILVAIAEELEAQIDEAEGNPKELSTLMGFYRRLSALDAQLDELQGGQAKLFAAMDLAAKDNREAFGF